ncbi:MAG: pyruvate, phosphate dikinase [Myxococcaceae bacterium]|nr:pyruvate, phosphate dikinase [Myxococcaceae bacterium]
MPLSRKRGLKKSSGSAKQRATKKWVYLFRQGRASQKALLGGKGANLCEMTRLGLPVPPGFIVSTEACNAYFDANGFPKGLWPQALAALKDLEAKTGRVFGDPFNPLLVSCRSGAKFSMPGMMDTVLNLGFTDAVASALSVKPGLERFTWDAYRRLVQMFSTVVLGLDHAPFEDELAARRREARVENDSGLDASTLADVTRRFLAIVHEKTGAPFPQDPLEQLRLAIEAVFKSWNGKRAIDYRNASGIPHDLGTAVNIQMMVFGNTGERSATGVVTTRNVSTGEKQLEGDYLLNAQGEDVVSGTRTTRRISALAEDMPEVARAFAKHCDTLERHFRDVQDVEFTVDDGTLWVLQTRDAKRSAQAAVRIAVELAKEKRISKDEAVLRVKPEHVDFFLHPQFDPKARKAALESGTLLAKGLNVSPGAATGAIVFDPDTAERLGRKEKKAVILVRAETKPDDVHGMLAAKGILTSRGGRTSHAALVARQFGKPAVVGVTALEVDVEQKRMTVKGRTFQEGDVVSLDGTTGEVFAGEVPTLVPAFDDPHLLTLLTWADAARTLGVWANADYPKDAERARRYGAEGIGLCRTEHMFFETERLPIVQQMILAATDAERDEALGKLLPMQRADFIGLFEAMKGQPVTIRLIDPPLHEFLPGHDELLQEVTELETRLKLDGQQVDALGLESRLSKQKRLLAAVEGLREQNPMLGLRGVRLGIHLPGLVRMQVRAIFEAACDCQRRGVKVYPKVMIPLTSLKSELTFERTLLEQEARAVMAEQKMKVKYQFGTMIEVPRAAVTADEIAELAEFFSFGTNDLTQTTFGISRDDAETGFLLEYLEKRILRENPFATLDQAGVGALMELAVKKGRKVRPSLEVGICGEHGGDPKTIAFCHRLGLTYVSCSPFRVPVARLAAAHAALESIR